MQDSINNISVKCWLNAKGFSYRVPASDGFSSKPGIVSPRQRRAPKHRSRRERYCQEGMLVQIGGSPHRWFGSKGPVSTLLAAIDDATRRVLGAVFRLQEDAQGYFLLMRGIVEKYGMLCRRSPAEIIPRNPPLYPHVGRIDRIRFSHITSDSDAPPRILPRPAYFNYPPFCAPARKIAAIPVSTRRRKPNFKRKNLYAKSFLLSHPVCFACAHRDAIISIPDFILNRTAQSVGVRVPVSGADLLANFRGGHSLAMHFLPFERNGLAKITNRTMLVRKAIEITFVSQSVLASAVARKLDQHLRDILGGLVCRSCPSAV